MSGDGCTSSDQVITKLIEMGFENSTVIEAVKAVGPSYHNAIEYILNGSHENCKGTKISTSNGKTLGKRAFSATSSGGQMRQSSILDHLRSGTRPKQSRSDAVSDVSISRSVALPSIAEEHKEPYSDINCSLETEPASLPVLFPEEVDTGSDWETKVNSLLQKHFGYSSLKNFQKEALSAWFAHQDCLVLAATGSGKSLCFQIPALLTGKVVVVISPLISLMHDQCFKLSKHGVSACFLGSGQPDSSVEQKAMRGMYSIVYVCPETVLRLMEPLQRLAEIRGIALFAIDEAHCVSKWGHDFRPDYRRMSILRENFNTNILKFLKFDVPVMALTATATMQVREDILRSLCMSKDTKIVLTSFFRSNLRFSVKHSITSSPASYKKDFCQLIDIYIRKGKTSEKEKTSVLQELDDQSDSSASIGISGPDRISPNYNIEDGNIDEDDDEVNSTMENVPNASWEEEMSVEYLENDVDVCQNVDDWDVSCGGFNGHSPCQYWNTYGSSEINDPPDKPNERLKILQEPLEQGLTIIYVPTRKETLRIAKHLCGFGVKAAAYNASLPKSHLRQVHKEFHENKLEVVVATIAFGMGIDKLNVRKIIHYGWPQSLEAYYQEAGRAGRDGKLADCILYANLSKVPTLLPNRRSEDQTKQAYKMLTDCFRFTLNTLIYCIMALFLSRCYVSDFLFTYRYGMNTSCCRAKILVEYFGEDFDYGKCLLCDVCVDGPPDMQNLKEGANVFLQVIAAHNVRSNFMDGSYDDGIRSDKIRHKFMEKPNLKMFVSIIRDQSQKFLATDLIWWQGLARIMENKGYIREGDEKVHVQIKFPEVTKLGLEFLQSESKESFNVYPEADMLLSTKKSKCYSSFSEWGKGWADPEIRRQRLERSSNRQPRKQRKPRRKRKWSRKSNPESSTVRGRLSAKLSKKK
ncbi:hypothetical protein Dsin_023661 [Dipteronia sinensis]|uniref:DNA 3'-5' helicase n=1 Tax=Dipteronia sinensis TaxID=43782 RepID=A0AAE0E140_9ROSI|nr:hypothetical protein Dsin_023661 [Dipteronia sinensis]